MEVFVGFVFQFAAGLIGEWKSKSGDAARAIRAALTGMRDACGVLTGSQERGGLTWQLIGFLGCEWWFDINIRFILQKPV